MEPPRRVGEGAAGPRYFPTDGRLLGAASAIIRILRGQEARAPEDVATYLYPLLATFLLTGGQRAEVLGLELDDVSFARKTVTFRPNRWRRLKTSTSARVVPLWPQLESNLRAYLIALGEDAPNGLLFPAQGGGGERMITDIDGLLDMLAERAGWDTAGTPWSSGFMDTSARQGIGLGSWNFGQSSMRSS